MLMMVYTIVFLLSFYALVNAHALYVILSGRERQISLQAARHFNIISLHTAFLGITAVLIVIKLLAAGSAAFIADSEVAKAFFPVLAFIETKNAIAQNREVMAGLSRDELDITLKGIDGLPVDLGICLAYVLYLILMLLNQFQLL